MADRLTRRWRPTEWATGPAVKAPGGSVVMVRSGCYLWSAWTSEVRIFAKGPVRSLAAAQLAVERWLASHAPKGKR